MYDFSRKIGTFYNLGFKQPFDTCWIGVEKQDPTENGPVASTSSQPPPPFLCIISHDWPLEALEYILPAKLTHVTIWSLMGPVRDYCIHSFIHSPNIY